MNLPALRALTRRIGVAALMLLAFASCESTSVPGTPPKVREPAWISLERTRGTAPESGPVYRVTLYEDGSVLFEGAASVKSKGTFSKQIPGAKAAAIFAMMDGINLWQMLTHYDEERSDGGTDSRILRVASRDVPWDILTARSLGRFKRIDGLFYAPHDLRHLKTHIEEAVGLAQWIGESSEWKP
jgi:hypothetical protein